MLFRRKPSKYLIGIHIPKSAGTSLRNAIQQTPLRKNATYVYDQAGWWGTEYKQFIDEYWTRHWQKRLIYGHLRYGLHETLGIEARYFTVLRHPIDRGISLFRHFKRMPTAPWHALVNEKGIEGVFDLSACPVGRNQSMTRMLASDWKSREMGDVDRPTTNRMLAMAKQNLQTQFDHVGITEDIERDLPGLSRVLGVALTLSRDNVDPEPLRKFDLSREEMCAIERAFSDDFELYEFAKRLRAERFVNSRERRSS